MPHEFFDQKGDNCRSVFMSDDFHGRWAGTAQVQGRSNGLIIDPQGDRGELNSNIVPVQVTSPMLLCNPISLMTGEYDHLHGYRGLRRLLVIFRFRLHCAGTSRGPDLVWPDGCEWHSDRERIQG